ncbi:MAG: hypothetical protein PHW04_08755 [Candidatus Wallbacteria bacterium]|nr:hypothetical protein [Candidatus Wallbacteria bacterium]
MIKIYLLDMIFSYLTTFFILFIIYFLFCGRKRTWVDHLIVAVAALLLSIPQWDLKSVKKILTSSETGVNNSELRIQDTEEITGGQGK